MCLAMQFVAPRRRVEKLVSNKTVAGCATFSTGRDAHKNSSSHCGFNRNFSTAAGTTTVSPVVKGTGGAPSVSIKPQPRVATKHQTLLRACRGRRNSHGRFILKWSTIKHGDVTR